MSKKRRKGGFCEKRTKLDTRYEKREGFEKKMDFRSHKTFNAKIQAENWKHFFLLITKLKMTFFSDNGERKGLFEFLDNVGLG